MFDIDMQNSPNCGAGELWLIAAILEQSVIERILTHLGLDPQPPPRGPAREADQGSGATLSGNTTPTAAHRGAARAVLRAVSAGHARVSINTGVADKSALLLTATDLLTSKQDVMARRQVQALRLWHFQSRGRFSLA